MKHASRDERIARLEAALYRCWTVASTQGCAGAHAVVKIAMDAIEDERRARGEPDPTPPRPF